ncbi:MAG: sugar phosphate nucleotidyltransferase [Chloroflexi bacterium]|nr:sugar phosphate nucleotidyltransferase [Chloroflexota bacterium]
MKTRAIILAGGEGSRLGILTAKRAKPAVPFAGKYRIIDFTLSNCVNSGIFDIMVMAQYRPQSLIEHIGAGGPWDLNRDFTGGVRIYTPYKARRPSDWYTGTADAIQQNFSFIKGGHPDQLIILSGDHIYAMDFEAMLTFHADHQADVTMATIRVPIVEASRFGIVGVDPTYRVTSFVEKPAHPPGDMANMGVYLFNLDVLDQALWEDHLREGSTHDFGKDVLPKLVAEGARVFGFPFNGYWVDVGTVTTYWQAHMDLLRDPPSFDLNRRDWIIHTRTEERPPALIQRGANISDCMIADGCLIERGAVIVRSVLSPGVIVRAGAVINESIIFTGTEVKSGAIIQHAVLDKRVVVGEGARIGSLGSGPEPVLAMVGKSSSLPPGIVIEPGSAIGPDVIPADFPEMVVRPGQYVQTRRLPYEV